VAGAPSNPSSSEARKIVEKLADPVFQTLIQNNPAAAKTEFTALLTGLNLAAPTNLSQLLQDALAKGTGPYEDVRKALDAALTPADVESVMKLAPPPAFGIHCAKLA
jgi:hypothetical protein